MRDLPRLTRVHPRRPHSGKRTLVTPSPCQHTNSAALVHAAAADRAALCSELYDIMLACAAGLSTLGLGDGDTIALFADNSARWLIADQAVMLNGAANAVRGATTSPAELAGIVLTAGCRAAVLQDADVLRRLLPALREAGGRLDYVVLLWGGADAAVAQECGVPVAPFDEVRAGPG